MGLSLGWAVPEERKQMEAHILSWLPVASWVALGEQVTRDMGSPWEEGGTGKVPGAGSGRVALLALGKARLGDSA